MHKSRLLVKTICLILLSGILFSCVKDVVLDAGDKTVVVECVLCDFPQQELRLSFSKGASESSVEELTEAVARLIDLTESETVGEFRRDDDGIWRLDYTAVPLHKYRLEVEVPGFDLIYAEDTMPDLVTIQGVYHSPVRDASVAKAFPLIPDGEMRCYDGNNIFSYQSTLPDGERNPHKLGKHIWICGIKPDSVTGEYKLADKICCQGSCWNYENYIDNYNITDEVYNAPLFLTDFPFKYEDNAFPTYLSFNHRFDGCKIHDGFIRVDDPDPSFFSAVDIWCDVFDMDTVEKEFMSLANSDHNFSENVRRYMSMNEYLTDIEGVFLNTDYQPTYPGSYIVFRYVSDVYNSYFEDARFQIRRQDKESTDMSEMSIYMRENIYSNVKGGAGIFAASTEKRIPVYIKPDVIYDFSYPL